MGAGIGTAAGVGERGKMRVQSQKKTRFQAMMSGICRLSSKAISSLS
jgi:hypothetical protein